MDDRDEVILKALERSNKISSRAIAKEVNLPISTVHRRIKQMERDGVIMGYRALINYEKTSWPIGAYVFINLEEPSSSKSKASKKDVVEELRRLDEVKEVAEVQGMGFNLIVKVRLRNLKALSSLIEKLRSTSGIEEISTAIITEELY